MELESPPLEATVVTERIRALGRSSAWAPAPAGLHPHPLFLYHRIRFLSLLRSIRFPVGLGFPCETHNSFNVTMTAGVGSLAAGGWPTALTAVSGLPSGSCTVPARASCPCFRECG